MNRQQRRAEQRRTPRAVRALAAHYKCPDCLSTNSSPYYDCGIWHLNVRHDSTCPSYQRLRRAGLAS
jgi:hypothetical protein